MHQVFNPTVSSCPEKDCLLSTHRNSLSTALPRLRLVITTPRLRSRCPLWAHWPQAVSPQLTCRVSRDADDTCGLCSPLSAYYSLSSWEAASPNFIHWFRFQFTWTKGTGHTENLWWSDSWNKSPKHQTSDVTLASGLSLSSSPMWLISGHHLIVLQSAGSKTAWWENNIKPGVSGGQRPTAGSHRLLVSEEPGLCLLSDSSSLLFPLTLLKPNRFRKKKCDWLGGSRRRTRGVWLVICRGRGGDRGSHICGLWRRKKWWEMMRISCLSFCQTAADLCSVCFCSPLFSAGFFSFHLTRVLSPFT